MRWVFQKREVVAAHNHDEKSGHENSFFCFELTVLARLNVERGEGFMSTGLGRVTPVVDCIVLYCICSPC